MLKEILSVSGKPGLYKLISQGKNMFIAESLIDHVRIPVYMRDKVVSLGDIAVYTDEEEVPLAEVFKKIKEKEAGKPIEFALTIQPAELRDYFASILPNYDRDRVYPSDMKKIMSWYNLLVKENRIDFDTPEETGESEEKTEETPENKSNN
ncbi:MAG: DUF5606 domain-containing protein [Dysgonamonadaceae bacterium]|jgi:hypothetical protein|nr:DUF5606 domain-containing protein [Dysgonamonadaceae bacterium]